jgi:hypothetical protein
MLLPGSTLEMPTEFIDFHIVTLLFFTCLGATVILFLFIYLSICVALGFELKASCLVGSTT